MTCGCSLEAIDKEKKLLYLSLYFLIWGEAANIRFLPECLCYIFHHVSQLLIVLFTNLRAELVSCFFFSFTCMWPMLVWLEAFSTGFLRLCCRKSYNISDAEKFEPCYLRLLSAKVDHSFAAFGWALCSCALMVLRFSNYI